MSKTIEESIKECKNHVKNYGIMLTDLIIRKSEIDAEKEQKKTYPVGLDPEGEHVVIPLIGSGEYEACKVSVIEKKWVMAALIDGCRFTTKDQAEKAAAGKNAMREFKQICHDCKEWIEGEFSHPVFGTMLIGVPVQKKGMTMKKIKLALEYGI